MTPEQEKKLDRALKLAEENNNILRKMRRSMLWTRIIRVVYIIIILGATFGAYYFIQPYLEGVLGAYSSLLSGAEQVGQFGGSLPDIGKILQNFGN